MHISQVKSEQSGWTTVKKEHQRTNVHKFDAFLISPLFGPDPEINGPFFGCYSLFIWKESSSVIS